jgi:hypothetical protein
MNEIDRKSSVVVDTHIFSRLINQNMMEMIDIEEVAIKEEETNSTQRS